MKIVKPAITAAVFSMVLSGCTALITPSNTETISSLANQGYDREYLNKSCSTPFVCGYDDLENRVQLTGYVGLNRALGHTVFKAVDVVRLGEGLKSERVLVEFQKGSKEWHFAKTIDVYIGKSKVWSSMVKRTDSNVNQFEVAGVHHTVLEEFYSAPMEISTLAKISDAITKKERVIARFYGKGGYQDLNMTAFSDENTLPQFIQNRIFFSK